AADDTPRSNRRRRRHGNRHSEVGGVQGRQEGCLRPQERGQLTTKGPAEKGAEAKSSPPDSRPNSGLARTPNGLPGGTCLCANECNEGTSLIASVCPRRTCV